MSETEQVNILIFDSHPTRISGYERCLIDLGTNLIKAGSPSEALSAMLKTNIAIALIGFDQPESSGFDLANMIRRRLCFENIPIIFITDSTIDISKLIEKYDHDSIDYVTTPVQPETLCAKVKKFIDLHRKTHDDRSQNTDFDRRVQERTDELLKDEAQLKMRTRLLDIATEAIIVRDLNGLITFWNSGAEKTYGWSHHEAVGQKIHDLLQTTFPVPFEQIEKQIQEEGSWHGRLTQSNKNGQKLVLDCRKTMNDEFDAVLEVNRDITTEIKAEEALRSNERLAAMGRVAGIIAHEINNPLAAITNIFYLLRNHPQLGDESRALLERAEQELERVSHITRQTLSFYREAKQPILVFAPEILDDVLELQSRSMRQNKITVRRQYRAAAPVTGYPAELRQVFLNLVGNAIQAMPDGGVLGAFIRESTDWTRNMRGTSVSIVDTGVGIQREDAGQLFQPFFSTKSTKGTGLGLWISRGIVQKYEGRITFRTVRSKKGNVTCFRVFLPSIGAFDRGPQVKSESLGHEYSLPAAH